MSIRLNMKKPTFDRKGFDWAVAELEPTLYTPDEARQKIKQASDARKNPQDICDTVNKECSTPIATPARISGIVRVILESQGLLDCSADVLQHYISLTLELAKTNQIANIFTLPRFYIFTEDPKSAAELFIPLFQYASSKNVETDNELGRNLIYLLSTDLQHFARQRNCSAEVRQLTDSLPSQLSRTDWSRAMSKKEHTKYETEAVRRILLAPDIQGIYGPIEKLVEGRLAQSADRLRDGEEGRRNVLCWWLTNLKGITCYAEAYQFLAKSIATTNGLLGYLDGTGRSSVIRPLEQKRKALEYVSKALAAMQPFVDRFLSNH